MFLPRILASPLVALPSSSEIKQDQPNDRQAWTAKSHLPKRITKTPSPTIEGAAVSRRMASSILYYITLYYMIFYTLYMQVMSISSSFFFRIRTTLDSGPACSCGDSAANSKMLCPSKGSALSGLYKYGCRKKRKAFVVCSQRVRIMQQCGKLKIRRKLIIQNYLVEKAFWAFAYFSLHYVLYEHFNIVCSLCVVEHTFKPILRKTWRKT